MIYSGYSYCKDMLLISDTLYGKEFKAVIKQYLHLDIKKDWIGRLYGVINPNIDITGKFNFNNMVIELDDDYSNNNEYVKYFLYKQLALISDLFKINKLYDYINMTIKHVGPVSQDNYLVIFDVVSRKEFMRTIKVFLIHFSIYAIIAGIVFAITL